MSALFITGAGTEIGKTYVACAILRSWKARGIACDALKPVLSGYEPSEAHGSDAGFCCVRWSGSRTRKRSKQFRRGAIERPLPRIMAARAEGRELPYEDVVALCRERAAAANGVLLIEGAGGVMAPLGGLVTNLDLIVALGVPVVFVAGSYLGAVSHALTGLAVLAARGVAVKAVIVNESAESVGLDATLSMLAPHLEDTPLLMMPRGQDMLRLPF